MDRIEAALGNGTLRWVDDSQGNATPDHSAGDPMIADQVFSNPKPRVASNGAASSKAAAVAAAAPARRASTTRTRTARVTNAES